MPSTCRSEATLAWILYPQVDGLDHDLSFPLAVNVCSKACESFF
jgi:hypothetical protein